MEQKIGSMAEGGEVDDAFVLLLQVRKRRVFLFTCSRVGRYPAVVD